MRRSVLVLWIVLGTGIATAQDFATIRATKGDVSVLKAGSKAYTAATPGLRLAIGDAMSTDIASEAVLGLPANAEVTIYEMTQIRINKMFLTQDATRLQLLLKSGRVETSIPERSLIRTDFSVKTPVATASIRGSRQLVAHAEGLGTTVKFLSGHGVTQAKNGRSIDLTEGQESLAHDDGSLTDPLDLETASASPELLPPGRDDTERSAPTQAGALNDRVLGEAAYPTSVTGDRVQAAVPIRLRVRLETLP